MAEIKVGKYFFLPQVNILLHHYKQWDYAQQENLKDNFWSTLKFTLVYMLAVIMGITKALPKHEYDGIENGSSDWCVNGEQYKVLNNKEGIILAEKNYLPVDKRGNVNVLVVGRIWCW